MPHSRTCAASESMPVASGQASDPWGVRAAGVISPGRGWSVITKTPHRISGQIFAIMIAAHLGRGSGHTTLPSDNSKKRLRSGCGRAERARPGRAGASGRSTHSFGMSGGAIGAGSTLAARPRPRLASGGVRGPLASARVRLRPRAAAWRTAPAPTPAASSRPDLAGEADHQFELGALVRWCDRVGDRHRREPALRGQRQFRERLEAGRLLDPGENVRVVLEPG
jgi:hypothetical protein